MRKLNRIPIDTPDCLKVLDTNSGKTTKQIYTERWKERVLRFQNGQIKNSPSFNWYQLDIKLRELLSNSSKNHCAFCDCKFTEDFSEHFPIEHFYPKNEEPDKAFEWENLFPICTTCNTCKGSQIDVKLVKPDLPDYEFNDYFIFNYKTGGIEPNPSTSKDKQEKASKTIEIYDLKRKGLCKDRNDELNEYERFKDIENNIDYYAHRDYIERVI